MKKQEKNYSYTIKDLPLEDRPQEKLFRYGPETLSNAELLALIIRTGNKKHTSVELAQSVLNEASRGKNTDNSFLNLKKLSPQELMEIPGIGESKAAMIVAALSISERMELKSNYVSRKIQCPEDAAEILMNSMKYLDRETFKIIILNTKKEVMAIRTVSTGTVNATIVHPRDVFNIALKELAHTIILTHNHPTGDPNPSPEDINITNTLKEAGEIMKVQVIDHIIIGNDRYYSFLENNLI